MDSKHENQESDPNNKSYQIYSNFMGRVAKFEDLVNLGSRLLAGFQQGLDYICRPPFEKTSKLVDQIVELNGTKRLKAYIEAGGLDVHECARSVSKSGDIVDELEVFIHEITSEVELVTDNLHQLQLKDIDLNDKTSQEESLCGNQKRDATDYAVLMAFIYSMVKQDFLMQEKIVSSLSLKSSSEELESYCMMWSLRPFIDEDVMYKAWKVFP